MPPFGFHVGEIGTKEVWWMTLQINWYQFSSRVAVLILLEVPTLLNAKGRSRNLG